MNHLIAPHPFVIPNVQLPKQFNGYVCILFAGERFHAGIDTNNSDDAYFDALRSARLSMIDACQVDKTLDPAPHAASVLMFKVTSDPLESLEIEVAE